MNKKNTHLKGSVLLLILIAFSLFLSSYQKSDNKDKDSQLDNSSNISLESLSELPPDGKFRVLAYNTFCGSMFPLDNGGAPSPGNSRQNVKNRIPNFVRLYNAFKPDIMSIQEAWVHRDSTLATEAGIVKYIDEMTSGKWYSASNKVQRQLVLSKYPIKWSKKLSLSLAVLIDLPDNISNEDLLMFNVHLPSSPREGRAENAKLVVDLINKVKRGEVPEVPSNAMVLVAGDYNTSYNGHSYKILSSLDPTIGASDSYEPKLKDLRPYQLGGDNRITCGSATIQGESISISGGSIDHMLFSGGAFEMTNSFILNTLILDQKTLDKFGLKRYDVVKDPNQPLDGRVSFDHLPVVSDFEIKN
ncbi:endonuclease/exonuclease/phosphatase family protein [Snuella sedimenti]|uniref:Endonuclease/exonuclease/phosphatase family protein n=1 Tax=Snuella sedimenti TaxID=2798802 RepID=A0A8J7LNM6_9FLAO|nr:endonuclease/exonuclease/phosphatase family protein [Snuella sedimenti]MBJ6368889.1 endonuclease/exonuclease/phosphatase family protein [Snuella sedimenti]